jgi:hypothetical protein
MQGLGPHGGQPETALEDAGWGQTTRLVIVLVLLTVLGPCSRVASQCHGPHAPAAPSLLRAR